MASIAIVGVGAVGTTIAAHLISHGRDPLLCSRTPTDVLEVTTPNETFQVRPRWAEDPTKTPNVPWVLLATKAHQTEGASTWLRALTTRSSTIAVLQNGVEHEERVAPYAGGATILPVVVECPSRRTGLGRVHLRSSAQLTVPQNQPGEEFAGLLAGTGIEVTTTSDLKTVAWTKLCLNVAGGAITALTDRTMEVLHHPDIRSLATEAIRECIRVGRAEGAQLTDETERTVLSALYAAPPTSGTSMLSDRRAGKPLESDARNGAVARLGARHGIPTPTNRVLAALLSAINDG